jgi:flagellar basal body rod protein FlgF
MKKFAYTLVTSLGTATTRQAEVPVHRDQTLTLQETLVIEEAGPSYYRNVRMATNADGSVSVLNAVEKHFTLGADGLPAA